MWKSVFSGNEEDIFPMTRKSRTPTQTKGTVVYTNGVYRGDLLDNVRHGRGIFTYKNKEFSSLDWMKYTGGWKNDKEEGKCRIEYNNGNIFEGFWEDGRKKGKGIFFFTDGSKRMGSWYNGKLSGKVKFTSSGNMEEEEYWVEGTFKLVEKLRTTEIIDHGNRFETSVHEHEKPMIGEDPQPVDDENGDLLCICCGVKKATKICWQCQKALWCGFKCQGDHMKVHRLKCYRETEHSKLDKLCKKNE